MRVLSQGSLGYRAGLRFAELPGQVIALTIAGCTSTISSSAAEFWTAVLEIVVETLS